jgi:hypothetical protein
LKQRQLFQHLQHLHHLQAQHPRQHQLHVMQHAKQHRVRVLQQIKPRPIKRHKIKRMQQQELQKQRP